MDMNHYTANGKALPWIVAAVILGALLLALLCAFGCVNPEMSAVRADVERIDAAVVDLGQEVNAVAETVEGDQNVGMFSGGAPYLLVAVLAMVSLAKHLAQKRAENGLSTVVNAVETATDQEASAAEVKAIVAAEESTSLDALVRKFVK